MHILRERIFEGRTLSTLLSMGPALQEQSSTAAQCGRAALMLVHAERFSRKSMPMGSEQMRQPVNPLVYDKPGMVAADQLLGGRHLAVSRALLPLHLVES